MGADATAFSVTANVLWYEMADCVTNEVIRPERKTMAATQVK